MKRIIVAITGATGVIYGIRLLEILKEAGIETHVMLSETAKKIADNQCANGRRKNHCIA